jgi:DNA-directed RNA polymerase subunit RPC12/RpoP
MDLAKDRKMICIEDGTTDGQNFVICPYCGQKNVFLKNRHGEPRVVKQCNHFTSIFMEAIHEQELKYNHYARFREV